MLERRFLGRGLFFRGAVACCVGLESLAGLYREGLGTGGIPGTVFCGPVARTGWKFNPVEGIAQ